MTDAILRIPNGVRVAAATWLAAATVASCASAALTPTEPPAAHPPVPDLPALTSLDGNTAWSLADHRDRIVVLDFMSAWCGPCIDGLPDQIALWERYHPRGVEFVLVAQDAPDDPELARLVETHAVPLTVVRDPDQVWLDAFGFRVVPALVIVDAEGGVALSVVDPETLEPGAVERLLDQLLAE